MNRGCSKPWLKQNLTNGMPDSSDIIPYLACHWSNFSGYCHSLLIPKFEIHPHNIFLTFKLLTTRVYMQKWQKLVVPCFLSDCSQYPLTQNQDDFRSVRHTVVCKDHFWKCYSVTKVLVFLAVLAKMEHLLFQEWKCPFQKWQQWPLSYGIFRWDK